MAVRRQRTSRKGRHFIRREEGVVPYAYPDPLGFATAYIGHLIRRGPLRQEDFVKYGSRAHPATMKQVMTVFRRDLKPFEKAVRKAVGRWLPKWKFDALVSLAFNIGTAGFTNSTAAKRVSDKAGEKAVAEAIMMWDTPSILINRRRREVRLYTTGQYK